MEALWQDVRYGLRMLTKRPAFAAVVVLTLALGIGANTAIFSVVNAVLLRPLPFRDPEQLVRLRAAGLREGADPVLYTNACSTFLAVQEQNQVFEGVVGQQFAVFNLSGEGEPVRLRGIRVSAGWFSTLGVQPVLGRGFLPEEERLGRDSHVVLVGHGLWQRHFGSDPGLLGRTLTLNGESFQVIGVMPPVFNYPYGAEIWEPTNFDRNQRGCSLNVAARLLPGVTLKQGLADLEAIRGRLAEEDPSRWEAFGLVALAMREDLIKDHARVILALLGAVGFLLLIACANVANLFLARLTARQKELAIRAALGASRLRQFRQLMTEGLLLALLGGALGLLVTAWLADLLVNLSPPGYSLSTFFRDIQLDWRVLTFTMLVSVSTGLIFGAVPALRTPSRSLPEVLSTGVRSRAGPAQHRLLKVLVVAEVALALVLLAGAGLMMQDFRQLLEADLGFAPEQRLVVRLVLPEYEYGTVGQRRTFVQELLRRVEALPGIQSAGVTTVLPIDETRETPTITIEGRESTSTRANLANIRLISPNYVKAMGIPLRRGRLFTEEEGLQPRLVVLVSEGMARRFWPGEDPIGKRFKMGGPDSRAPWMPIVGIVGDVRDSGDVKETWYLPYTVSGGFGLAEGFRLVVNTRADPASFAAALREAIWSIDRNMPVNRMATMEEIVRDSFNQERLGTTLFGSFAGFGLLLAAMGIYGVMAYVVGERTHEFGVRMALGARRQDILRLVVRQGMLLALLGVGIGLAGSFALTRFLSSLLIGVSATDPLTFAGVSLLLTVVALLACYLPARRATRVDPMVALRYE